MSILTAKTKSGKLITLSSKMNRDELRKWRQTASFFCPQCDVPVHLKVGEIVIPHFAHKSDTSCVSLFSEGESKEHLTGKIQLYEFFQSINKDVQLEPYFKLLSQRPDLLVTKKNSLVPIEFQCSPIPVSMIESRTEGYRNAGMDPIWILHTPTKFNTLPQGFGTFHFSRFHESFFTNESPEGLVFLTYYPQTESFHYFSSLVHIEGKRYIGNHRTLHISAQQFPFARPTPPTTQEIKRFVASYRSMRKNYLKSRVFVNRRGINDPFLRRCYELRIHPVDLPLWIGIPVPFGESFREHDCEWQLGLYYFMRQLGIGFSALSDNMIRKYVSRLEGPSERKWKACIAYRDFLNSISTESPHMGIQFDEKNIFRLLSVRFLATR